MMMKRFKNYAPIVYNFLIHFFTFTSITAVVFIFTLVFIFAVVFISLCSFIRHLCAASRLLVIFIVRVTVVLPPAALIPGPQWLLEEKASRNRRTPFISKASCEPQAGTHVP